LKIHGLFALALCGFAFCPAFAAADDLGLHIYAMQADGGDVRKVASFPEHPSVCSPEISPDGRRIAVDAWRAGEPSTDAHVLIFHLAEGRIEDLGIGCMPSWSAEGDSIAYCRYGEGVFIRSLDDGKQVCIDPKGWAIQWSPSGKLLAYVRQGNLVVHNLATGKQFEVFPEEERPYTHIHHNPTWSPDSTKICFLGLRGDGRQELAYVTAKPLMAPELDALRSGHDLNPDIAWRPDGGEILAVQQSVDGRPGQMLAVPVERSAEAAHFAGQPADRSNGGMSWSRDGKTLYFMSAK
jgi:Tol biopolymer transport system component